jgi:hypothetical protein
MRLKILILAIAAAACARAATITVTFGYNFVAGNVACSATLATNCWSHFEAGTLSAAGAFTTLVSIPLPAAPVGAVSGIAGTFTQMGVFGAETLAVIMVANDGSGNRIASNPTAATASVTISPASPLLPSASVVP